MRMMLKILIPTDAGNDAIKDGSLSKLFENAIRKLNAEASYFVAQDGLRCAFDLFRHEGLFRDSRHRRAAIHGRQCRDRAGPSNECRTI